ncbi:hypothetical protein FPOAC1_012666 [Fusarium poae]|uniref:hypothetical protein n=1 Tax=Fusarium poae TaxID=36050 RepID=UPI001CE7644E|nr:hypothetical protein FPOAC1_012666 [Fusarium poae]KAG8667827.1 hypothetical protein FPOAC1_012666 [Fusarium poae]
MPPQVLPFFPIELFNTHQLPLLPQKMHAVLETISEWAPFQIDALGLVTIFGAKEMNTCVGNLTKSWVTEWLPILGSYAVANNEIADPEHGYILYNITDGIMATDVAAWFTRWLSSFPPNYASTVIRLKIDEKPLPVARSIFAMAIGGSAMVLSLCLAILTADPWGIANSLAMCGQVFVRQHMVGQLRASMDKTISDVDRDPGKDVKTFLTLPNGKAVTIVGPLGLVLGCIVTDARPLNPRYYFLARAIGWAFFATHAIALGMSNLFNQIVTVIIMLVGTYLTATRVGDNSEMIGSGLRLEVEMGDSGWTRSQAYANIGMTPEEEDKMVHWSLMPQKSNTRWWKRYNAREFTMSPRSTVISLERQFEEEGPR